MAAAFGHRDPGWRLPRRSALAKKYDVSLGEIDAAIDELARRSLVRRLPDGQLFRASPAEHWIPVEGVPGLGTRLDPMGNTLECQTRQVSRREAPEDVAGALGLAAGALVRVADCVWSAAGDPVATAITYRQEPADGGRGHAGHDDGLAPFAAPDGLPLPAAALRPAAVSVEMSSSQPAVARALRLAPGHPVVMVTIRFDDPVTRVPAGLTVVTLRPELFRVAIDTAGALAPPDHA